MLPDSLKWVPILILPAEGILDAPCPRRQQEAMEHPTFRWKPLSPKTPEVAGMVQRFRGGVGKRWVDLSAPSQGGLAPQGWAQDHQDFPFWK